MSRITGRLETQLWLFYLLLTLTAVFSFVFVFALPQTPSVKTISVIARYNTSYLLPVVILLLLPALSIRNHHISYLLTAFIVFALFAFGLNGLWASAYTETNTIAALLPRKDAFPLFNGAVTLLEQGHLSGWGQHRPFFSGLFASLLWVSGYRFRLVLALIAFLSAATAYFALMEVRKTFNPLAALVFFLPQYLYYRKYTGNVMTETLGYLLGMAAFALFLAALRDQRWPRLRRMWTFTLAVFLFALSQFTRPGAILTLPLLVLFAYWISRSDKKFALRAGLVVFLVILLAYALNTGIYEVIHSGEANQNDNVFLGVYGVVVGGRGWGQIRRDYPELSTLTSADERVKLMAQATLNAFLSEPMNLLKGMGHQFNIIFSLKPVHTANVFSAFLSGNAFFDTVVIAAYSFLSLLGLTVAVVRWGQPLYLFLVTLTLGFLGSLIVAPAYHAMFMRYYPATIPLLGLLPAIGLGALVERIFKRWKLHIPLAAAGPDLIPLNAGLTLALTIFMLITPLLLAAVPRSPFTPENACQDGETEVLMPYYPGTAVNIVTIGDTWAPQISEDDFRIEINKIPDSATKEAFKAIPLPTAIFPSINLLNYEPVYVVIPSKNLPGKRAFLRACGRSNYYIEFSEGEGLFFPRMIRIE